MNDPSFLSTAEYHTILRNDFTTFIERSFMELNPEANFIPGRYVELLASTLDKCRTGTTNRLIINLPPRTLKSHAASVAFPAFLLGHDPSKQIICASYGQDLSDKHARDCRRLMSSSFYRSVFPGTVVSPQKSSINDFETTLQGGRMSTSVGGVLTGRGGDVVILDDILKPDDALSETRRKAANEWYFHTLLSRLNSKEKGIIILVMQRLHQEDLVAEVLERGPWDVLSLPAIATQDENHSFESLFGSQSYVRKAGEALHPERDSVETYQKIREAVGEYNFQCQYQQDPAAREGGLIKREWIKTYDPERFNPRFRRITQSWDTANKAGEFNDYSVCTTWGVEGVNFYLLDVFRRKLTYPQLKHSLIDLHRKFQPTNVLIEDKSSGISLIQELEAEYIYYVVPCKTDPGVDKYMRLAAESVKFESGRVFLPTQAPWLEDYVREITSFPGSKYADQVDSTSQALKYLGDDIVGPAYR